MKLGTRNRLEPSVKYVVIPRFKEDGSAEDCAFTLRTVLDFSNFDKVCPEPIPPMRVMAGSSISIPVLDDPDFTKQRLEWGKRKVNWIVLESLKATEDLEWQDVKDSDPSTWHKYKDELKVFGLNDLEITKIINTAFEINAVNDELLEEARKRFLAGKVPQNGN